MIRSWTPRRLAVATVAAGLATLAILPQAAAAPAANSVSVAYVRGAHFSPDTPGVDVYLTSFSGKTTKLWLTDVGYGDVSPYFRLAPGLYVVSMRLHGAAASTPPAFSWNANVQAGSAYTAAAIGHNAALHGIVLRDTLSMPPPGHAMVRVIQAASRAAHATFAAKNGPVVASNVAFGTTTGYTEIPSGTWPIEASSTESPSVTSSTSVSVKPGSVNSLVLLDSKSSGVTLRSVVDASSAATPPAGAVPAGGGGTAPKADHSLPVQLWTLGLLGVALALIMAFVVRPKALAVRPEAVALRTALAERSKALAIRTKALATRTRASAAQPTYVGAHRVE
jgi:Domain of unknown function (DUF4397)